jgi:maltooligosyltrehalose trehalohydrolase
MVLLDVVYNHFGPDGNYLPSYSPILTENHHTPWGAAVNYDAEGSSVVREFIIQNAIYWVQEFHLDGLRLDAVHAIKDDSSTHLLEELATRVRNLSTVRPVHLVLENEENEASRLNRNALGDPLHYTAQWNDDVHHVLHCVATGETSGYYAAYAGETDKLARALAEGFAFQGELMRYRDSPRGEPSAHLPPTCFVAFIQNHDQVGNRAFGDRINSHAPTEAVRAIAAIYLLLPQVPLIFMGEEFGADQPFPFFCDFEPELAERVRDGRRNEFAKFPEFHDPQNRERIPDPTREQTFLSAKLDWSSLGERAHADFVDLYRDLLAIRKKEIVPRLKGSTSGSYELLGDNAVSVSWRLGDGGRLRLLANLASRPLNGSFAPVGRKLWSTGIQSSLGPWTVHWSLES